MRDIVCQRIKAFLDFAFPDDNDMPAGLLQGGLLLFVAGDIACELLGPEFHVGFWHCGDFAAFMAMPEATVDENHRMPFGQNDIGMAGQFRRMEAVAEAQHMQMMAHDQFRLRVLRPDFAHGFAAFFWRDGIHIELNRMDGTDGTDGTDCQTQYSIIYTMRMLGACFLHACEIGSQHAAENAWKMCMMAESMAVRDGQTP